MSAFPCIKEQPTQIAKLIHIQNCAYRMHPRSISVIAPSPGHHLQSKNSHNAKDEQELQTLSAQ